jgi:hypothetical protein
VVDTTKRRVTIRAAGGQLAGFYDGIFRLSQGKGAKGLTRLTLVDALSCPKAGKAIAAAKKKRRLWRRRQRQVPHQGQAQRRHGRRYQLARRGPL